MMLPPEVGSWEWLMEESGPRRGTGIVVLVLVVMALASLQGVSSLVSDSADPTRGERQQRAAEAPAQGPSSPADAPLLLPSARPSPEPGGGDDDEVDVAGLRFARFADRYPKACLRAVDRPPRGKLAAFQGGFVSIVTPGSDRVVRIDTTPPLAWSPSGRYLATGRGDLYRPSGRGNGSLLNKGSPVWEWSPTADCAVAADGSGVWVDGPDLDPRRILALPGVERFSFSSNGRLLGFVVRERASSSIWIANLERGSARRLARYGRRTPMVELLDWNASGTRLFYGLGAGESASVDGVALRFISPGAARPRRAGATLVPNDDPVTHCGGRDLVVAGAGGDANANKRLAYLGPSGPTFITPTSAAVVSPSCSPTGGYIAAIASSDGAALSARRLALLRADGTFERFLAPDGSGDEYPVWGPPGTGVAFVRMRPSGRLADLWFIPEGGSARPTPLAVAVLPNDHGTYDWERVLDWSAAP